MRTIRVHACCLVALATLWQLGCFPQLTNTTSTSRSQVSDDVADPNKPGLVGERTIVSNAEPIQVFGVGLVYNLQGTGSSPPPGEQRAALENMILKMKGKPKELLDDPSRATSLVLVSATIPPGCRNGDKVDVNITLPPGSKSTSLKGGILFTCDLANYELAGTVREAMTASGIPTGKTPAASDLTPLMGSRMAIAEGALVAGSLSSEKTETANEEPELRVGKIWGGAKVMLDRPYYFVMTDTSSQPRLAMVIAERLNSVFHATGDRFGKVAEAKVQGKPIVLTYVPPAYRLNPARFLLVARQVPLVQIDATSPYRQQLEHDLVRPESTIIAAIKLEALGVESRQALRVGLQSDSPWVRFSAAESLAYLGHPDGAKELAMLAKSYPALRTHCLTALASMDDGASMDLLVELMKEPDTQLRYGAFVALRTSNPDHEAVRGQSMNRSYWLHHVASVNGEESAIAVHVSSMRRAEIVVFGNQCPVTGNHTFSIGKEYTVAIKDGSVATITRVVVQNGEPVAVQTNCRAELTSILTSLSELGGTYSEAVELVNRLDKAEMLPTPVAYDKAPRGIPIQQLVQIARSDPTLSRANLEVERVGQAEVIHASYDLPTEAESVQNKQTEPETPSLNREPGRIFGPTTKR